MDEKTQKMLLDFNEKLGQQVSKLKREAEQLRRDNERQERIIIELEKKLKQYDNSKPVS